MIEEIVDMPVGDLNLEGILQYEDNLDKPKGLVMVLSPHPFLGGDMNNNVVKAIAHEVAVAGYIVLRFNYRGMGGSECDINLEANQQLFWENSTCPEYETKIYADVEAAYQYLCKSFKGMGPPDVVGYSFGCLAAMDLGHRHSSVHRLFLVSPPVAQWVVPEAHLGIGKPKTIYYTLGDFACPESKVLEVYESMSEPKFIHKIEANDHFYIGHENNLTCRIIQSLE